MHHQTAPHHPAHVNRHSYRHAVRLEQATAAACRFAPVSAVATVPLTSGSGAVSSSCNVASVDTAKRGASPVALAKSSASTAITRAAGTVLDTMNDTPNLLPACWRSVNRKSPVVVCAKPDARRLRRVHQDGDPAATVLRRECRDQRFEIGHHCRGCRCCSRCRDRCHAVQQSGRTRCRRCRAVDQVGVECDRRIIGHALPNDAFNGGCAVARHFLGEGRYDDEFGWLQLDRAEAARRTGLALPSPTQFPASDPMVPGAIAARTGIFSVATPGGNV